MKKIALLSFLVTGAALLSACSGSSAYKGTVRINLTDAPACGYEHVYVSIDHIDLSSDDGATWTSLPVKASVGRIDLLGLQNGILQQLVQTPLAAGTYNQVRLVLKNNGNSGPWANSVVLSGAKTETPLSTPSAQQSGYKIEGTFNVMPGTTADLNLDFNACLSIAAAGKSGQYNLKPVVRAVAQIVSGSITGTTTAGASVYAEQAGQVITGTVTAPNGNFTLSPLEQSSNGGDIDVVIVPPASANEMTAVIQNVPVTAGTATSLGTVTPDATTINSVNGTVNTTTWADASLTVTQTISTPLSTYQIATQQETSGAYSFSLPATGPDIGDYTSSLPIILSPDTDSGDAGNYTVAATDAAGGSDSQTIDISGASTSAEFSLTP